MLSEGTPTCFHFNQYCQYHQVPKQSSEEDITIIVPKPPYHTIATMKKRLQLSQWITVSSTLSITLIYHSIGILSLRKKKVHKLPGMMKILANNHSFHKSRNLERRYKTQVSVKTDRFLLLPCLLSPLTYAGLGYGDSFAATRDLHGLRILESSTRKSLLYGIV